MVESTRVSHMQDKWTRFPAEPLTEDRSLGFHWDTLRCHVQLGAAAVLCFRVAVTNSEHQGLGFIVGVRGGGGPVSGQALRPQFGCRAGLHAVSLARKGVCGFLEDWSLQLHLHNHGQEMNRQW